jgi:hypothetical protein
LTVIQNPPEESGEPPRPAWQWILFDVLVTLAIWVGLAAPATFLRMKVIASYETINPPQDLRFLVMTTAPHLIALMVSTGFGGYLLGRFGGVTASVKEALIAASIVSALAIVISLGMPIAVPITITTLALGCAYGGAVYGRKKR